MHIQRPNHKAEIFEGIPNCFISEIESGSLFPCSAIISSSSSEPIEFVLEGLSESVDQTLSKITVDLIQNAVSVACRQYAENIEPEDIEARFQDYLTEDLDLTVDAAVKLFREEGLAPFLVLRRIFVSEPLSAICLDFACFGEEYLEEHGFSFDILRDRVEFVTPRDLMPEGSYPASRHT